MAETLRKTHKSSFSAPCLITLHISLHPDEIQPMIWRRLRVDGRVSLGKLHHFIQAAFGWSDAHLHEFIVGERRFGVPDPDNFFDDSALEDDRKAYLNRLVAEGDRLIYLYDFGDSWTHVVTVETIEPADNDPAGAAWVEAGSRACPPEDVGGFMGYHQFLETLLTQPHSEQAQEYRNWAGGDFDAERFDRQAANAAISRMLWNRWGGK